MSIGKPIMSNRETSKGPVKKKMKSAKDPMNVGMKDYNKEMNEFNSQRSNDRAQRALRTMGAHINPLNRSQNRLNNISDINAKIRKIVSHQVKGQKDTYKRPK
jgi:hypothetical protein